MSDKKFYVYVHRRATDGSVFYVGKGHGNRFNWPHGRSKYWQNVVNKHGFTSNIVMRFDSEACAFSFERALIKHYGRENLVNLTDGGEGVSGFYPGEETRMKMSKAQTGRKHSPETLKKMSEYQSKNHPMKGRKHSPETIEKMSGRPHYTHPMFDDEERCFLHEDGSVFVGTRYDFNSAENADPSSTSKMIRGIISHHKGWRPHP